MQLKSILKQQLSKCITAIVLRRANGSQSPNYLCKAPQHGSINPKKVYRNFLVATLYFTT